MSLTSRCPTCTRSVRVSADGRVAPQNDGTGARCSQRASPNGVRAATAGRVSTPPRVVPVATRPYFAICPVCREEHRTIREGGLLAIHNNSSGDRCAGSPTPGQVRPPRRAERRSETETSQPRTGAEKAQAGRAKRQRRGEEAVFGKSGRDWSLLTRKYREQAASTKPERIIYVSKNAHVVGGGSPTLGKRH